MTNAPTSKPIIALTQGDPAGIGPEICLKAIAVPAVLDCCRPVIIGDRSVLEQFASHLDLGLPETVYSEIEVLDSGDGPVLIDCGITDEKIEPGKPTRLAGEASYKYLEVAIEGAIGGIFDAITTAPITKTTLHLAGIKEPGHTEILGRLTDTENFAMMLYSPRLAVGFVTCHQSLRSVPESLTVENILRVTGLTRETLRRIRGREPRLAVLGLNPHGGEDGIFGLEDRDIVAPAVELARNEGWDVEGPIPADTAFTPSALERYDGHIALYHDQGAIPFKMISFHDGVNITMGLPIIRTSVDHGTAYDIAWHGTANVSSMVSAIRLAANLASS